MSSSSVLSSSAARCEVLPLPEDANTNWPGFALMSATRSFTVFTGSEGCTTSTLWTAAMRVMGAKSRTGSQPILGYRLTLMENDAETPSSV